MENFLRFYVFDLRNKTYRTLIEIPRTDVKGIIAYSRGADTDGRTLFVVFGGSILAIDIRSGQVHDFAEIYYTPQKITRLIVDRGQAGGFYSIQRHIYHRPKKLLCRVQARKHTILLNRKPTRS